MDSMLVSFILGSPMRLGGGADISYGQHRRSRAEERGWLRPMTASDYPDFPRFSLQFYGATFDLTGDNHTVGADGGVLLGAWRN
jgi:hypothetical protein